MTETSRTPARRAVIYVRESLDSWGDARAVERFKQQCHRLCDARGLTVIRVLVDNNVRASTRNQGDGYAEMMTMLRERQTDYVVIPVVDRFFRNMRDLEDVIDTCVETGAVLVAASGEIDLSHDQGRLVARLLTSVAKAETERKGARHRDANEQAARNGRRRTAAPRPFGYQTDHITPEPAEADAIRWAAGCLLGGGTVSSVMREWNSRGLASPQGGKAFTRNSVTTILRNPALAGLSVYRGEVVGEGTWEPVLPRGTWEAVRSLLGDPSRKPPRGVRTLLGGLALCRCGNTIIGGQRNGKYSTYRCNPQTRNGRPGPHLGGARSAPVDEFITAVIVGRLARPDLADLLTPPPDVDAAGLRTEAASIRRNLDEMAADRALGLVSRAQMLAATQRGNARLEVIAALLASSAQSSALAPFLAGQRAQQVWESLDLARQRAVIRFLATVTINPAGRGARTFDPETVVIDWHS
jgi:DNA invertase Pin-like site-specific DNA recombinase